MYFTADSDLKNVSIVPPKKFNHIVTAPHHGSAINKAVYKIYSTDAIWVRSDMKQSIRPCIQYKNLPQLSGESLKGVACMW